jgi:DNA-binding NarL/FixJ family response regulator
VTVIDNNTQEHSTRILLVGTTRRSDRHWPSCSRGRGSSPWPARRARWPRRAFLRKTPDAFDVAVVDLALPDGDGFRLIEELSSRPDMMTLVLSASLEPNRFARAVEAGAAGVLHKSAPIDDIVEAVRRLRSGEALPSPAEVVEMLHMVSRKRQEEYETRRAIEKLTPREKQVLTALGEGLASKDIAEKLHITVETERTHMVNILGKLDVHSRLQALVFAARHGLVEIR